MSAIKVIIIVDDHGGRNGGHISLEVEGPVRGKAGLLALLDSARDLATQMREVPRADT